MTVEASLRPRLGIDIGGTTITVAVTDAQGELEALEHGEVGIQRGVAELLDHALTLAQVALNRVDLRISKVAGVGLALPGEVDVDSGMFRASPILPDWRNVPVRDLVRERTGLPVVIENDANAALLAEHRWGAAKDVDSALLITIGTGIGGAVLCGGRILHGNLGSAGEIGHVCVETGGKRCLCGGVGCLGLYASTTALLADYARRCGGAGGCATGYEFASRYRQDDAHAHAALKRMGDYLARAIAAAVSVVAPAKVILFGGILDSLAEALVAVTAAPLRRRPYPRAIAGVQLEPAKLGSKGGALGASILLENVPQTSRVEASVGAFKKNVLRLAKQSIIAHGGHGEIDFVRPFARADFETGLSFIDYAVIPPGHSIGRHRHGDNEEVYFIVSGTGRMTTNGVEHRVEAGDLIVNRRQWEHGLYNDSQEALTILVWEVA